LYVCSDPACLVLLPGTLTEYSVSGGCGPCGDLLNGGVLYPSREPAALDGRLMHLASNLPWPQEASSISLQQLVAARLAEAQDILCGNCGVRLQDGRLEAQPGSIDMLFLRRNMDPPRLDVTAQPTYCPGMTCFTGGQEQFCPGHLPPLKNPTPVARPDPACPVFPGKELVAVLGHHGRRDTAGHWSAWVWQGGQWLSADSLKGGSLLPEDPFNIQIGGPGSQQQQPVTLGIFAFR
jgi:hypothetical protein